MKITALVENTTQSNEFEAMHGLSLYIETKKHKLLVDVGNNGIFLKNAQKLGIDISKVDTLIITHGHSDHGGSLRDFLDINKTAKVYIQRSAFLPHFTRAIKLLKINIGLDPSLLNHPQIALLEGNYTIDNELSLIANPKGTLFLPRFNATLLEKNGKTYKKDEFAHEQSVIINDDKTVLIGGCAHRGVLNFLEQAKQTLKKDMDICISGFHLFNPAAQKSEGEQVIIDIANAIKPYPTKFYTCHCTGIKPYEILKRELNDQIDYLSTGQTIEI